MRKKDFPEIHFKSIVEELLEEVAAGNVAQIKALLDAGGDPNASFCYADAARRKLSEEDFDNILSLNEKGDRVDPNLFFTTTPLITAVVSRRKLEVLRLLLDAGADPNLANSNGTTPLMFSPSLPITRLLLMRGAKINARDHQGSTALIHSTNTRVTKYLIESGADVHAADVNGVTALHQSPDDECTAALLAAGADPNARTKEGGTPLMYAVNKFQIQLLLDAGADATAVDNDGMTPLHYAAILNYPHAVKFWVTRMDVNVQDTAGHTALELAFENDSHAAARVLMNNGAIPFFIQKKQREMFPDYFTDFPPYPED